jgi:ferredoxin-NADP reductase
LVDHDLIRREHGYHPLRVKRIVQETADTRSFVLEVPDDLADLFVYRPGQFCTFRVPIDGDEQLRSYSMSSAPETDGDLTVTVKRVPQGLVSNWFHDHVSEGDVLEATKPAGVFCTHEGPRPIVGLCGGSGVTPVMSITKSVLAGSDRPVRLLYANRDREAVIFHDELEQLGKRHPERLDVRHHLDADTGFLDAAAIGAFVGTDLDADFYICGPGPFMDLVESTLLELGVAAARIAIERFENAGQVVPADGAPADTEGADAGGTDSEAAADAPANVTIILKGKRHEIAYRAGDTILETARRGGLQAPFSCEAGNCATCMALVHEGSATMRANNALTPDEVEEGFVLTCQAVPHSPTFTVEYESL